MELHQQTLKQLSTMLKSKHVSAYELTVHFLQRAHRYAKLNALITIADEQAMEQAKLADQYISQGNVNCLTGLPIIHKDLFCTKGVLTSCGSKMLHNFISPYDASIVQQLNACGMVTLAKANMDEFAMGSSNENSAYGPVHNPWNNRHVPGGSSGGSAAAVAARLSPVATGSDTGGSVRQPAAYCGITGIKPSYGRVSRYGMVAFASSLDQAGVLATDAQDAAILLKAIAGFDEKDSTSINRNVPDYMATLSDKMQGKTIGLPKEYFTGGIDNAISDCIDQAIKTYESVGVKFIEVSLPNSKFAIPCYYVIALAEASSNLSRYDGVRYGHRSDNSYDLKSLYEKSRSEGFGKEVKRRIILGTYVLSAGYYDDYYRKAQCLRRMIADDFNTALGQCDFILGPTTPTTAFELNSKIDDPISMYLNDIYTTSTNLAGLPGISIPCGFDEKGLPIGMQLTGHYFDEGGLLNAAHQYQTITDWHLQMPQGY